MERELDGISREFYEFVMPAIDIIEEDNDLYSPLISRALPRRTLISELSAMSCT
jgi:hypothetical protein